MAEMKVIDLKRTVFDLCTDYPEMVEFMKDLGFADIAKPGMLNTAGRFMTLSKGAKMKGIDIEQVVRQLEAAGFAVVR